MSEFTNFGLLNWPKVRKAEQEVVPGYTGNITRMPLAENPYAERELIIKHFCAYFGDCFVSAVSPPASCSATCEVAWLINKHCWLLPKGALLTRLGET